MIVGTGVHDHWGMTGLSHLWGDGKIVLLQMTLLTLVHSVWVWRLINLVMSNRCASHECIISLFIYFSLICSYFF